MEFIAPSLLAGMLAGALPIIVHLIHRERPKVVPFTLLRFVRNSARASSRSMRLKHLLLLLLRILLVVLFALILARPMTKHLSVVAGTKAITQVVLILDDSFLMGLKDDAGTTHFEHAKKKAAELVRLLPKGSPLAFYPASQEPFEFTIDMSSVSRALELAQPSSQLPPCAVAIQRAYELFGKAVGSVKEIYVFTNLSLGTWKPLPVNLPEGGEEVRLVIVDVGPEREGNLVLMEALPSSFGVDRNSPIRLQCKLHNFGEERKCGIDLIFNGEKRASRELTIPGGQSIRASIPYEFHESGVAQGRIRIVEEDSLDVDNERYFSVLVHDPLTVLAITRDEGGEDAFYVAHALSPSGLRGRERVDLKVINLSELSEYPIEEVNSVLLLDLPRLERKSWERLFKYVERGGGLGVIAGNTLDTQHYNNLPELPVEILDLRQNQNDVLTLGPMQHPFLDRFRIKGLGALRLTTFQSYLALAPPGEENPMRALAFFSEGRPALLEHQIGRGRIFLFACTFTTDWSNLPKSIVFPPFVYEFVNYLAGRQAIPTSYNPGERVIVPLRQDEKEAVVSVFEPGSEAPITLTALSDSGTAIHKTSQVIGNAHVFIKTEKKTRKFGYSVNIRAHPDDYRHINEEELKEQFPQAERLSFEDKLSRKVGDSARGSEIAPLLLLLLAALLCAELFLGNWIYK